MQETAGIDIITDGEIRRELLTASPRAGGIDIDNPAGRGRHGTEIVPRVIGESAARIRCRCAMSKCCGR
jgi:hypothetical protein